MLKKKKKKKKEEKIKRKDSHTQETGWVSGSVLKEVLTGCPWA